MIDLDSYFDTPADYCKKIAERLVVRRKKLKMTQIQLSQRSGVSFSSLRRFESTGQVSLESLIRIAFVLDLKDDLNQLFVDRKVYTSIQDVIDEANHKR